MTTPLPFGSWPSPISAASLVAGAAGINEVCVDGEDIWWGESRPEEKGRTALVRWRDGVTSEPLDSESNVRTGVHEYGGGAWWAQAETVWFVEWADQRLRRLDDGSDPVLLSPEPAAARGLRYADGRPTPDKAWFVCVREDHGDGDHHVEPANEIVAVAGDGSLTVNVLVSGPDFVSTPRLSPDGSQLCWVQWMHPNMPWDVTELWVADFADGAITNARRVAGGDAESIVEPEWSADGALYAVSDRTEWWNLYRYDVATPDAEPTPIVAGEFEVATPQWVFNMHRWAVTPAGAWAAATANGRDQLYGPDGVVLDTWSAVNSVRPWGDGVVFVGAGWTSESEVVAISGPGAEPQVIRAARDLNLPAGTLVAPTHITFAVGDPADGAVAHALFHPPSNAAHVGLDGERPPLLVKAHGGPTGGARSQMQLGTAYWTSRGVAVVDVNYRGSVGYGRSFRDALQGEWGVADVEDCVAAATFLAERGEVDADRLAIAGGSAGGFTVLAALTLHDVFAVGASRYGVADLGVLATDTHKFEARYLDGLVGPWPEAKAVYDARSPINHTDKLSCPMIILQGGEDKVVPPNQAELMVAALADKGLAHAYLLFPEEGHGFRQAPNIVRALEGELSFFGQVLGFEPAGDIPPVDVR